MACSSANHAENLTVRCDNWRLSFDTWQLSIRIFRSDSGAVYFIKFPSEFVINRASAKSFVIIVLRDTQTVLIGHMCFVKSSVKYILLETSKLGTYVCDFRDFSSVVFNLLLLFTHMIPRPTECSNVNCFKLVRRVFIAAFRKEETTKPTQLNQYLQRIVLVAWSLPWCYLNVKYLSRSALVTHI